MRRAAWCTCLLLAAASGCSDAGPRWREPLEVARGAGERGPWQQNDSRYDFVDDPAVAWSPQGELGIAWVDQARKAVLFQRYSADGRPRWPAPVDVSRRPRTFSWLPRLAWAPDAPGRVYVLWQEIVFSGGSHGGEMLLARSDDGGRSFGAPLNLSRSVAGDGKGRITAQAWHNGSFDLLAGAGGIVHAAWTEYEGRLWTSRSTDGGLSFSAPLRVAGDPPARPARAPALALSPQGEVLLAWSQGDDPAGDIQLAISGDGARSFEPARAVAVTPGYSDAPSLAFDARGVLHLVHAESTGGPFAAHAIRHLRSTDGGRSFGAAREISRPAPAGAGSAGFPALGVDARGRVAVSWELFARPGDAPRGLGLAVSEDGVDFGAAQAVPGSADAAGGFNGSSQGWLMRKLAVRADGEFALANSALKPGSHSRVWVMRGTLDRRDPGPPAPRK